MRLTGGFAMAIVAAAAIVGTASCNQQSLVNIDVFGDRAFTSVVLELGIAGSVPKSFSPVSFTATTPYKAGIFLPSGVTGSVRIVGQVVIGNCVEAQGAITVSSLKAGDSTAPVAMVIMSQTEVCPSVDGGIDQRSDDGPVDAGRGAGGTGGGTGTGGSGTGGAGSGGSGAGGAGSGGMGTGGGTAGIGGRMGTGGAGTGGAGTGGAGTGGMGTGGISGTGGAACPGTTPPNFGQSCGFCGGTVACSGSCSKADTECAPTGEWHQFRNALPSTQDLVLDVYANSTETFMDIPCCSGSAWAITPVPGGYSVMDQDSTTMVLTTDSTGATVFLGTTTGDDGVWTITALSGGYFRLTNNMLGAGYSLELTQNSMSAAPLMGVTDPNSVGQRWLISP
jgi:hypothetical protein